MSNCLRLFVGIFPSQSTQKQLHQAAASWCKNLQTEVRLLKPELLHLTVKFIGNVESTRLNDLTTAFLKISGNLPSASLDIKQFKLFPNQRKPRVVAADIERSPELNYLVQCCEESFSNLGIIRDPRAFQPHITLARARRWQKENISPYTFRLVEPIESIALVHSQLSREGAKYRVIASVPLN
ncbi:MAG: RNA 2',3'-cyclic phosphodiesterase [Xenococcaceae cyanobacterium]